MDSSNTIVSINTLALDLRRRSVSVHSNTIPRATIQCISQSVCGVLWVLLMDASMGQLVSKEAVIYLREDWSTVLRDNGHRFAGSKTKQLLLHASNLDTQHTTVRH